MCKNMRQWRTIWCKNLNLKWLSHETEMAWRCVDRHRKILRTYIVRRWILTFYTVPLTFICLLATFERCASKELPTFVWVCLVNITEEVFCIRYRNLSIFLKSRSCMYVHVTELMKIWERGSFKISKTSARNNFECSQFSALVAYICISTYICIVFSLNVT